MEPIQSTAGAVPVLNEKGNLKLTVKFYSLTYNITNIVNYTSHRKIFPSLSFSHLLF